MRRAHADRTEQGRRRPPGVLRRTKTFLLEQGCRRTRADAPAARCSSKSSFRAGQVDCEYDRLGDRTLRLPRGTIVSTDDHLGKSIYPDIVVHQRAIPNNLLAVEVRKSTNHQPLEHDQHKLRALTDPHVWFAYWIGVLLTLGKTQVDVGSLYQRRARTRLCPAWFAGAAEGCGAERWMKSANEYEMTLTCSRSILAVARCRPLQRAPAMSGRKGSPRAGPGSRFSPSPRVVKSLDDIKADDDRTFAEQKRITEIPAPPFKEKVRAEYYLKRMQELGLKDACDRRRRQCDRAAQGQRRRPAEAGGVGASRHGVSRRHRRHRQGEGRRHCRARDRRRSRAGLAALLSLIKAINENAGRDRRRHHVRRHGRRGRARQSARRQGAVPRSP